VQGWRLLVVFAYSRGAKNYPNSGIWEVRVVEAGLYVFWQPNLVL
jgi:hypothetical protein